MSRDDLCGKSVHHAWFWFCVNSGFHYMRPTFCDGQDAHAECGPRQRPRDVDKTEEEKTD